MLSGGITTAPPMLFPAGEGAARLPVGHPMAPPAQDQAQPMGHQQGTGCKLAAGEPKHKPLQGAVGDQLAEQPWLLTGGLRGKWLSPSLGVLALHG